MRSCSGCMPHIRVCKEESAHFRYPLAGGIHVDCYLGKGPRVGKGRQAMQQFRCEFWWHCGDFLLAGSICRTVFGCCAFAACSMFLFSLISLLDERPVLIDHGVEILVCSNGCPARIGSIISLVLSALASMSLASSSRALA